MKDRRFLVDDVVYGVAVFTSAALLLAAAVVQLWPADVSAAAALRQAEQPCRAPFG
jgi:hypothetical protein